ncbi:SDR family oxidoreductase [Caldimonas brevitalea]|uniref:Pteridine reductase n=1 Tax=Caldimonas brevitalea TaxID=413882 RepID=A0A0G3BG06_9BURK|nr:SDR family oxidoreductase [Caldimonas brevitalea]AKJ28344.1 pteridine reductase [Caldimonas brevitalea]
MSWALVTGSSARGGAAISRRLHAAGLNIVAHHSPRSKDATAALVAELNALRPDSARPWEADLAVPFDVPVWLRDLAPEHCICNASVYRPSQLDDTARASEDLSVHVLAHATILMALQDGLRSVVGVGDIHVERPPRGHVWYTVSKAGLQALLMTLAVEWAPRVRCNVVAPGALPFPPDWSDPEREKAVLRSIPLGRLGTFDELAETVKWLTLDASYVTGQVLALDGGRRRWLA